MDKLIWIDKRAFINHLEWECYQHGYYLKSVCGHDKNQAVKSQKLLLNPAKFSETINKIFINWPVTTAVHLSNESINKRSWLGRMASFYLYSCCEKCVNVAWSRLSMAEQAAANHIADTHINEWVDSCERESFQKQKSQLELMY